MQKIKKAYKDKNYTLIKNAINLKSFGLDFDFNSLFEFYNTYPISNYLSKNENSLNVFQMVNVVNKDTSIFFNAYLTFLNNIMKNTFNHNMGNLDFFFSTKGEVGSSHVDPEHVLILGVYNNTYYHIKGKDIKLCPGDLLYIYKGNIHHSFSSTERIVLSLSLWEIND
jgi:hypothetical protein|tara:strand:- start:386 stop:889 length:504 start_codon:yes stop_codon:yes gene_type:complete